MKLFKTQCETIWSELQLANNTAPETIKQHFQATLTITCITLSVYTTTCCWDKQYGDKRMMNSLHNFQLQVIIHLCV